MVRSVQLCVSENLNNLDAAWQRPRGKVNTNDWIWYCNITHAEKHLGGMLSRMSVKYKLVTVHKPFSTCNQLSNINLSPYTNHSLRVTSFQTLDDAKIEGRHTIHLNRHKSTMSVQNCTRKLSANRKRSIYTVLRMLVNLKMYTKKFLRHSLMSTVVGTVVQKYQTTH